MRKPAAVLCALAVVLAAVIPATAAGPPSGRGAGDPPEAGPRVKAKVSVEGVVIAIHDAASTFTMRVLTPGHRRQVGAWTAVVLMPAGTDLRATAGESGTQFVRTASIRDLRVGDRVHVEMFRLDDGRFLALRIHVKNRAVAGPAVPPLGAEAHGAVIARGASSLVVLRPDGSIKTVLVTSTTVVRGDRGSFDAIQLHDTVTVQGTVNADGSITAQRIQVRAAGTSVTGVITLKSTVGPQLLVLHHGLAVNVSADTLIISGGQRRTYAELQVGQTITVTGTPVVVAGVTVGINARVIVF